MTQSMRVRKNLRELPRDIESILTKVSLMDFLLAPLLHRDVHRRVSNAYAHNTLTSVPHNAVTRLHRRQLRT